MSIGTTKLTVKGFGGAARANAVYLRSPHADYNLRENLALTLRLNQVSVGTPTPPGGQQNFASLFPGIQVWVLEHLKVSFEYGFQNEARPGLGALQAEVAF